jgi:hypothetical protein
LTTSDGGITWIAPGGIAAPPDAAATWIDPANPSRQARVETRGVAVTLDNGRTWTSWHNMAGAEVEHVTPIGGFPYWVFVTEADGRTSAIKSRADLSADPPAAQTVRNGSRPPAANTVIAGQRANVVVADVVRPTLRFAGTDTGVFVSFDAGRAWTSLQLNLPPVPVHDLVVHGADLVAATYGRSVWVLDDIGRLREISTTAPESATRLFAPSEAWRIQASSMSVANIDYDIGAPVSGPIALRVVDAGGRVVHSVTSAASADDPWLAVTPPLTTAPGVHRLRWNLRADPPPSPANRYARLAEALRDDRPEPTGLVVPPGTYRVDLTAGARTYSQPLVIRADANAKPSAAPSEMQRRFDLAMTVSSAMKAVHADFAAISSVRAQLAPFIHAADADLAQLASDFDSRLVAIDGTDWTGLVLPDLDRKPGSDEVEEDLRDEVPVLPVAPVTLTKDYDDPTMIIGRRYENAAHAPALTILAFELGDLLTRLDGSDTAPNAAETASARRLRDDVATVQSAWRQALTGDLPAFNRELRRRGLKEIAAR